MVTIAAVAGSSHPATGRGEIHLGQLDDTWIVLVHAAGNAVHDVTRVGRLHSRPHVVSEIVALVRADSTPTWPSTRSFRI